MFINLEPLLSLNKVLLIASAKPSLMLSPSVERKNAVEKSLFYCIFPYDTSKFNSGAWKTISTILMLDKGRLEKNPYKEMFYTDKMHRDR